jgi:hypothetical protein
MKKIIVNGKEYNSLSDLPGLLQNIIKDSNKNGIPDIAEKNMQNVTKEGTIQKAKIIVRGREYNSVEEMSDDDRKYFEKNMKNLKGVNVHHLMTAFGGIFGYLISKWLKLPGSDKKKYVKPENKRQISIADNSDKIRTIVFVLIILGIIGGVVMLNVR